MNTYYDLDRGVPSDQADDFDKWCDEQRKEREKEILSLQDYDTARLTLMEMDKLKNENKSLNKELEAYKKKYKDCFYAAEKMVFTIEKSIKDYNTHPYKEIIKSYKKE